GKYRDPRATEYMIATLAERRNKIGSTFFSRILPLDHFRIENDDLRFDDLAVSYGFHSARTYEVRWALFDNIKNVHSPISGTGSIHLPQEAKRVAPGDYFCAEIRAAGDPLKQVTIYFRREGNAYKLVGVDRGW